MNNFLFECFNSTILDLQRIKAKRFESDDALLCCLLSVDDECRTSGESITNFDASVGAISTFLIRLQPSTVAKFKEQRNSGVFQSDARFLNYLVMLYEREFGSLEREISNEDTDEAKPTLVVHIDSLTPLRLTPFQKDIQSTSIYGAAEVEGCSSCVVLLPKLTLSKSHRDVLIEKMRAQALTKTQPADVANVTVTGTCIPSSTSGRPTPNSTPLTIPARSNSACFTRKEANQEQRATVMHTAPRTGFREIRPKPTAAPPASKLPLTRPTTITVGQFTFVPVPHCQPPVAPTIVDLPVKCVEPNILRKKSSQPRGAPPIGDIPKQCVEPKRMGVQTRVAPPIVNAPKECVDQTNFRRICPKPVSVTGGKNMQALSGFLTRVNNMQRKVGNPLTANASQISTSTSLLESNFSQGCSLEHQSANTLTPQVTSLSSAVEVKSEPIDESTNSSDGLIIPDFVEPEWDTGVKFESISSVDRDLAMDVSDDSVGALDTAQSNDSLQTPLLSATGFPEVNINQMSVTNNTGTYVLIVPSTAAPATEVSTASTKTLPSVSKPTKTIQIGASSAVVSEAVLLPVDTRVPSTSNVSVRQREIASSASLPTRRQNINVNISLEEFGCIRLLQLVPFKSLHLDNQLLIVGAGPPQPDLKLETMSSERLTARVTKFHRGHYRSWMCGCSEQNAFFCFPCLIFNQGMDTVWTRTGTRNMNLLWTEAVKHELSSNHFDSCIKLANFKQEHLERLSKKKDMTEKKEVARNRYALSRIIDCLKICGTNNILYRMSHWSDPSSVKHEVFTNMVNFLTDHEGTLNEYIKTSPVFNGQLIEIQKDLIDCALKVLRERITEELDQSKFVALQVYEIWDGLEERRIVLTFRYVVGTKVVERFWGCAKVPEKKDDAVWLTTFILDQLPMKDTPNKLIAQSYDQEFYLFKHSKVASETLKKTYPDAHVVHCNSRPLDKVVAQMASHCRSAGFFFGGLDAMSKFFSKMEEYSDQLKASAKKTMPSVSTVEWDSPAAATAFIHENFDAVHEFFKAVRLGDYPATLETKGEARTILWSFDEKDSFKFYLDIFAKIMPVVSVFYNDFHRTTITVDQMKCFIAGFRLAILTIKKTIPPSANTLNENQKRERDWLDSRDQWQNEAREICDLIVDRVTDRFSFSKCLQANQIVDCFINSRGGVKNQTVENVLDGYQMLNGQRLRLELEACCKKELRVKGVSELYKTLVDSGLGDSFIEVCKLLQVIMTTPTATNEDARRCDTLAKVGQFMRSLKTVEKVNARCMMFVEWQFMELKDFTEKLVEKFANLPHRRNDFLLSY